VGKSTLLLQVAAMLGSDTSVSAPVIPFAAASEQEVELEESVDDEFEEDGDDNDEELDDEEEIEDEEIEDEEFEEEEIEEEEIADDVSVMTLHPGEAVLYVSAEESVEQASQRFLSFLLSCAMPITLQGISLS